MAYFHHVSFLYVFRDQASVARIDLSYVLNAIEQTLFSIEDPILKRTEK